MRNSAIAPSGGLRPPALPRDFQDVGGRSSLQAVHRAQLFLIRAMARQRPLAGLFPLHALPHPHSQALSSVATHGAQAMRTEEHGAARRRRPPEAHRYRVRCNARHAPALQPGISSQRLPDLLRRCGPGSAAPANPSLQGPCPAASARGVIDPAPAQHACLGHARALPDTTPSCSGWTAVPCTGPSAGSSCLPRAGTVSRCCQAASTLSRSRCSAEIAPRFLRAADLHPRYGGVYGCGLSQDACSSALAPSDCCALPSASAVPPPFLSFVGPVASVPRFPAVLPAWALCSSLLTVPCSCSWSNIRVTGPIVRLSRKRALPTGSPCENGARLRTQSTAPSRLALRRGSLLASRRAPSMRRRASSTTRRPGPASRTSLGNTGRP